MGDIQSPRLLYLKGGLFLFVACCSAALVLIQSPSLQVAGLLGILSWSSCRFYYFLFYVIERYVAPEDRYRGIWDFVRRTRDR